MRNRNRNAAVTERYSDSITTENRGDVRLSELRPDEKLKIYGKWIKVSDIPMTAATLSCTHPVRGIALQLNDVVFCETCHDNSFVADIHN